MTKRTLLDQYQDAVLERKIQRDVAQIRTVKKLDQLLNRLRKPGGKKWWPFSTTVSTRGLYLWGKVGTGKTYLMDLFYQEIPVKKMRMHFHRFMKMMHDELNHFTGKKNPLNLLAKKIAKEASVICFDEFVVTNIVDAMLLAGLLRALFDEGVVLVATSNVAPDHLYEGGLQRDKFLPAIAYIKTYTEVLEVDSQCDYRLKKHEVTDVFLSPVNAENENRFNHYLAAYDITLSQTTLELTHRKLPCLGVSTVAACFDFQTLFEGDRSQLDYLELAEKFDAIFVRDITAIAPEKNNYIARWISFIDVLYDEKVKLIFLSHVPLEEIYQQGEYKKTYERTESRLYEMQSQEYLAEAKTA